MTTLLSPTLYVVTRTHGFLADSVQRERGELLDTSDWVTRPQALVNQRHLAEFHGDPDAITTCPCGRQWENAAAAAAHRCPKRNAA